MTIDTEILNKIKRGELVMQPRWKFVVRTALIAVTTVLLFLVSIFLVSFVFYILRTTGIEALPQFGGRGFFVLLTLFPWLPVLVALVLTVILGVLLKRFSFAYRKPLLYLPVALIAVITFGSIVVHLFGLHDHFGRFAEQRHLPLAPGLYRGFRHHSDDMVATGVVTAMTEDTIVIMQPDIDDELNVHIGSSTTVSPNLSVGDRIVVFGKRTKNAIEAVGVRPWVLPEMQNRPKPMR